MVVIAIIGILTAIVISSLSSAKLKSKDSAVKTQLSSMRVQAEIFYDLNGNSYENLCFKSALERGFGGDNGPGLLLDTKKATAIVSNISLSEGSGAYNNITCHVSSDGSAWAVDALMSDSKAGAPKMFCVDSVNSKAGHVVSDFLGTDDTTCS